MAIITSHLLNGIDGSHAGGIKITLTKIGSASPLAQSHSDDGGRVSIEIPSEEIEINCQYEIVIDVEAYWRQRGMNDSNLISEIVLRFEMTTVDGKYHMPVILSPFSYSTWKSG